jgi:hypothetical protein
MAKPSMTDIRIDEALWASSMLPEGTVERWFASDGGIVLAGQPVAEVRVEDCLHIIPAPGAGRLRIDIPANAVIEPDARIGVLEV